MTTAPAPLLIDFLRMTQDGTELVTVAFKQPQDKGALPAHSIVGHAPLANGKPQWQLFSPNQRFIEFFIRYMQGTQKNRPELLDKARVNQGEFIYAIDRRNPTPTGDVPFRDIIGWYRSTSDGKADAGTFEYNKEHKLALDDGTFSSIVSDAHVHQAVLATK